jgi:hypothetical protein
MTFSDLFGPLDMHFESPSLHFDLFTEAPPALKLPSEQFEMTKTNKIRDANVLI